MQSIPDYTIKCYNTLSPTQLKELSILAKKNDYEPFFDGCPSFYIAESNDSNTNKKILGFLSFIINEYDDKKEFEITAVTDVSYRQYGIFTNLLNYAKKDILTNEISYPGKINFIAQLPHYMLDSSFPSSYAYDEYLMLIDKSTYINTLNNNSNINGNSNCTKSNTINQIITFLSDDESEYLLYDDPNADEPAAVCSLDYSDSFTVLYGVFTDENKRQHGLGFNLINNLLLDYFEINKNSSNHFINKTDNILLNVQSRNTAAVKLYTKCGFYISENISYYYI